MAGGKGVILQNAILDHVLGGPDYTRLGTVYIALYTTAPTSSGGGTEVSTSGTAYSRQSVTNTTASWTATSAGVKSNVNLIDFGTATSNWGTINAGTIMSDPSTGYILYYGPLTTPKTINTSDGFRIPIGGLVLTES
jgi:hypothetical protein